MYREITLPAPVLTVRTEDLSMQTRASPTWEEAWVVRVWCGENVLFERKYIDTDDVWERGDHAYSQSDAEHKCLEEFTRRWKKLLDD